MQEFKFVKVPMFKILEMIAELRVPNRVRVHTNKKYPEILSAEW